VSGIVWAIDASQLELNNLDDFPLYRNDLVEAYLRNDLQYVLLGPKGVGKTLLLKLKSHQCRRKHMVCYPKNQLCEIVLRGGTNFRAEELDSFKTLDQWKSVWRLVLSVLALRTLGIEVNAASYPFPYNEIDPSLDAILAQVIRHRGLWVEYDHFFSDRVAPAFSAVDAPFAAFLDRLDETLGKHTGSTLRSYEEEKHTGEGHLSYEVWLAAQCGLMEAVRELREKNPHLKFFVTARYEAAKAANSATAQNLSSICVDLRYARWELQRMFEMKLRSLKKISPASFIRGTGDDLYAGFFGFTTYTHPRVRDRSGLPIEEHIFDCLLRHTRGSPRELEEIARDIGALPAKERNVKTVRKIINNKSRVFFDYCHSQALPYWPTLMDDFLGQLRSNVISRRELKRLAAKFETSAKAGAPDASAVARRDLVTAAPEFLFQHGLLGYAWKDEDTGKFYQRFNVNDLGEPASIEEFRKAKVYLLHPCTDLFVDARCRVYERDCWNIIGQGKQFYDRNPLLHVHFGAGQIGCGLVVPILRSAPDVHVCMVQRPSPRWEPIIAGASKTVRVVVETGEDHSEYHFHLLIDALDEKHKSKLLWEWVRGEKHLLALTASGDLIQKILRVAHSVSTASKYGAVKEIAEKIATAIPGRAVSLFPFENDERCFSLFRSELAGCNNISVGDTVVDRICTAQRVEEKAVKVTTEPGYWVALYRNDPDQRAACPFLMATEDPEGGSVAPILGDVNRQIAVVRTKREFIFLHSAKRLLVNGIHFAAAIYGYSELVSTPVKVPVSLWGAQISQLIFRDPDIKQSISPIAGYYMAKILTQYRATDTSADEMYEKACFLKQLFAQSWMRIRRMPDSLERILPPTKGVMTDKWDRFFGNMPPKDIKKVFRDVDDAWAIEANEAMVHAAFSQLAGRYASVIGVLT
jgi:hypothetical protein